MDGKTAALATKRALLLLMLLPRAVPAAAACPWLLPVKTADRACWRTIRLSPIGAFGLRRKARPAIPAHLHAGIDIARPSGNYIDEPVFAAGCGRVVSVRRDGPYSQVIVAHETGGAPVWTAYEHLQGISVALGEEVTPDRPIGRFMTRRELTRWGWHFDHVHFEVLKIHPLPFPANRRLPDYRCHTYNLQCASEQDLARAYFDPEAFLKGKWRGH